jgi:hypothetical protein
LEALGAYLARVAVPFLVVAAFVTLVPRAARGVRLAGLILLFVFVRDAMTPVGLWTLSPTLTIRFVEDPLALVLLAGGCVGMAVWACVAIDGLREVRVWTHGRVWVAVAGGVLGGLVIGGPAVVRGVVSAEAAGPRGVAVVGGILAVTMLGNVLEEVLFRGHLHGVLRGLGVSQGRLVLLSGGAFMICHAHLAAVTTAIGWPVLVFTFYEGVICAWLRERAGLLAASVAHGLGVFLIAVS